MTTDTPEQPGERRSGRVDRLQSWLVATCAARIWRLGRRVGASLQTRRVRALLLIAMVGVVLASLAWTVYSNWETLTGYNWQFDLRYLGVSFACYSAALFLSILTWHTIIRCLAGLTDFKLNARVYLYSAIAKRLPGVVWHIASRLYLYQQEGIAKTVTSTGLALETVMMIVAGMAVYLCSLLFGQRELLGGASPWLWLGLVPLLVVMIQPSILVRAVNAVLVKLGRARLEVQVRRRDSLLWVGLYAANWVAGGLSLYFLTLAIHPLPAAALFDVVGILALSGVLSLIAFFVPGGWGIREVSLALALRPYLPLPLAVAVPLLFRLWLILGEIFWVGVSAALSSRSGH